MDRLENRKEAERVLAAQIESPAIRQFLLKNLTRNKRNGGFEWKMNLPVIKAYYEQILSSCLEPEDVFDGETLFLKAERSSYIVPKDKELIRQHFRNAIIETIPNTGHWLHAEAPNEVVKVILNFLAQ